MSRRPRDPNTDDLFSAERYFPVRAPEAMPRALDFNRQVAQAMARARTESGKSNEQLAAEMTDILGYQDSAVTPSQLYAYTAPSRETHTISLVRFKAFVRATGCLWLWDVVLADEGLTLLQGAEARHAQASLMRKQATELAARARELEAAAPIRFREDK
ncbi:MAG: hypothetical protein ACK4RV_11625 [Caulobacter sp.]